MDLKRLQKKHKWITMQCEDLLSITWSQSCWLHRLYIHPVLITVFIEPTYIVCLSDTCLMNWCRRGFCCTFGLSRWQQLYVKKMCCAQVLYALEYNINTQSLKLYNNNNNNNLTESSGSGKKVLRTFSAAFCLASFLFFPTPSGYTLPFRTALKVNLRKIYKILSKWFKNVVRQRLLY